MSIRLTIEEFNALRDSQEEKKALPKIAKRDNKYKQQIDLILMALKVEYETEYKFLPDRKFRADYAVPKLKIIVEYEGLPLQVAKSRHTTIKGYCQDNEKYSLANIAGWCVIHVNAISVQSGLAHELIKLAIERRRKPCD